MSSSLSDFQKMLRKTQQEMLMKPKEKAKEEKVNEKSKFIKFQQLPSEIKIPQAKPVENRQSNFGSLKGEKNGKSSGTGKGIYTSSKGPIEANTKQSSSGSTSSTIAKPKSFKELMKMAKTVKPEGLIAKEKTPRQDEIPRERIRSALPFDGGSRQIGQPQKYRVVEPVFKMKQPKSTVHSPQTSKRSKKYVPTDLIKLNTNKRDLATTEEIQEELLRKRGVIKKPIFKDSRTMGGSIGKSSSSEQSKSVNRDRDLKSHARSQSDSHTRSSSASRIKSISRTNPVPERRRERSAERYGSRDNDYSSIIQDIFGRGRKRPAYDDYSDDSSDMEANFDDIYKEEQRSLKIGKREDEITEMELKAKAEAKMKRYA